MKIDRRSFLSFMIGGAAGTALTPLPWKLTDDLSIWTQKWPWTPVPPKGETRYTHSVCTLCPGGCGITVRKVDDRAVKIEGMPGHPVNNGGICILGLSGLQLLYGPNRIKTPLKRDGKRGQGQWRPISWQQALEEVGARLAGLRNENKPQALSSIVGRGDNTFTRLFERFMSVYGSPNLIRTTSVWDSLSLTMEIMHGRRSTVGYDLENADFVISFGSGILDGWGSPVRMFQARSRWCENKTTLVQLEPRLSRTAAKADVWLPVNPGTEAAFALGMAQVILKESLYSQAFVQQHTAGFSGWRRLILEEYPPQRVSEITGIDAGRIEKTARAFAGASRPLAICGRGRGDQPVGLEEAMAVHALNALAGNINQPGGVWALPPADSADWPAVERDAIAQKGFESAPAARDSLTARSRYSRFADKVLSGDHVVEMLLVSDANPCYEMPDADAVRRAFEKIPYIISCSAYMDETAMQADIILPDHTYLERLQDVTTVDGYNRPLIGLAKPVVWPLYNTRHTGDVLIELAHSIGGGVANAFPWNDFEQCLAESLGDRWETLQETVFEIKEDFKPAPWEKAFTTASGKFEFGDTRRDLLPGYNPMPPEGDPAAYPLMLIAYDSMRLVSRGVSDPPFVVKTVEDTVIKGKDVLVEINPKTAAAYGLKEGAAVRLTTPKGEARVKVHLFEGIMPGLAAIPTGLGHQGGNPYMKGKGVNARRLIGSVEDPVSGLDRAWGTRAQLKKA